jgi:hypothetical protein
MCLACELDALWYAEWERLATEGATVPGTAGVSQPDDAAGAAEVADADCGDAAFSSPASLEARTDMPQRQIREWVDDAGMPTAPQRPAAPRSGFLCEETE